MPCGVCLLVSGRTLIISHKTIQEAATAATFTASATAAGARTVISKGQHTAFLFLCVLLLYIGVFVSFFGLQVEVEVVKKFKVSCVEDGKKVVSNTWVILLSLTSS